MDCRECQDVLSAIQDGEAAGGELRAVDRHLQACDACRAHREALERIRLRLRAWPDEAPRAGATRATAPAGAGAAWRSRRWAAAAALLLAAALGFVAGRASAPPRPAPAEARRGPGPVFTESRVVVPARNQVYATAVLVLADRAAPREREK